MVKVLTDSLKDEIQSNQALLNKSFDLDFQKLLESYHHLPCLTHVI